MELSASAHVRGCVLYFSLFMAYGCVLPFMPLIWRSKGLSEHQIGLLGAIYPIVSFFCTPVACAFADRHKIQQQTLYVALFLHAVTQSFVLLARSFLAVAAVEISISVSESPVSSLVDSAVRHAFGGDGFGSLRLWGAVGFGIASLVAGFMSDLNGGSYAGVMLVFVVNQLVALTASTGVPVGHVNNASDNDNNHQDGEGARVGNASGDTLAPVDRNMDDAGVRRGHQEHEGESSSPRAMVSSTTTATASAAAADDRLGRYDDEAQTNDSDALLESRPGDNSMVGGGKRAQGAEGARDNAGVAMAIRIMLGTDESASFFMAVVLSGIGRGVIDTFLFIRLEELGGSHVLCGLARLIMCVGEVLFFHLSGPLIRRVGVRRVIALAQLAFIIRFVYYSILREPWWVLPAEVLHGLTFAAMWAATTDYAHQISPAHLRTTIQGTVSGVYGGLGHGLGSTLGGLLYAGLGARRCFAVSSSLPSLSLLLLALPTLHRWCRSHDMGGRPRTAGLVTRRKHGGDDGRMYELVGKKRLRNDDQTNKTDHSSKSSSSESGNFSDGHNLGEQPGERAPA